MRRCSAYADQLGDLLRIPIPVSARLAFRSRLAGAILRRECEKARSFQRQRQHRRRRRRQHFREMYVPSLHGKWKLLARIGLGSGECGRRVWPFPQFKPPPAPLDRARRRRTLKVTAEAAELRKAVSRGRPWSVPSSVRRPMAMAMASACVGYIGFPSHAAAAAVTGWRRQMHAYYAARLAAADNGEARGQKGEQTSVRSCPRFLRASVRRHFLDFLHLR